MKQQRLKSWLVRNGIISLSPSLGAHVFFLVVTVVSLLAFLTHGAIAQDSAPPQAGLQQSYSQYFNLRHLKSGHVFQGRYKAIVCDKDEYLMQLIRYIHLNPVRAGMVKDPEKYSYSGHRVYLDGKVSETIDPRKVLSVMGGRARYRAFVGDGMNDGHKEEYYEVSDQSFLGAEGFGEKLQDEQDEARPKKRRPLEKVIQELSRLLAVQAPVLKSADRSWAVSQARTKITYVLVRRQGYGLSEVARYFARDAATIGTLIGRLSGRMEDDNNLRTEVEKLNRKVET